MKLDTPRSLRVSVGFPLLEKGGAFPEGVGWYLEGRRAGGLSYAAARTGLAHWHSFMLLIVVQCTAIPRKPTIATKTLGRLLSVKVYKLFWHVRPSHIHAVKASLILLTSSRPMKSCKASRFETSSSNSAWVKGCKLFHASNVVGFIPDLTHAFNVSISLICKNYTKISQLSKLLSNLF